MSGSDATRRQLLLAAAIAPVALAWRSAALAAETPACVDPAALPLAQKRQRRAINYVEPSPDAKKRCGGCAFFSAIGKPNGCGTCQLLSGGPVSAIGLCNSFAPKAG
jgi:High potential iron-sulfur protein